MVTRAQMKKGKTFQTSYKDPASSDVIIHQFYTRESNDSFAFGMELMGVNEISKGYYDGQARQWLPYVKD